MPTGEGKFRWVMSVEMPSKILLLSVGISTRPGCASSYDNKDRRLLFTAELLMHVKRTEFDGEILTSSLAPVGSHI